MPGRTPAEAVRAYTDPLQSAVSCLAGVAKIAMSKRVRAIGDQGAWILNSAAGMRLDGFGTFFAQQRFELVPTTEDVHPDYRQLPYRVSTRDYNYRLKLDDGGHEIRWHWHPVGHSDEPRPHIHPSFNLKAHIPGPRYALEGPSVQPGGRHQPTPQRSTAGFGKHPPRACRPRPGAGNSTRERPRRPVRAKRGFCPSIRGSSAASRPERWRVGANYVGARSQ